MKKKLISGVLALLLCVGGLPACNFDIGALMGGGSSTDSESVEESSGEESSTESSVDSSTEDSSTEDSSAGSSADSSGEIEDIVTEEMSIHFLYLGNATPGDCTLIKVGDTEVLIDAGSTTGSVATIVPYISEYCTDGVLEYVVATHADSDHISGFVGGSRLGVFDSFVCKTIIEYAQSNKDTQIRKDYEALRDKEVEEGATRYTALECWKETNGAKRSYTLGEGITMEILYQKYYEQKTSDENDYSVCLLLTQNETHYLFTGDLEGNGEKSLVASNDLPQCKLFKGGHHGSATSNTPVLLSVIQPEIVCVCTCCGETNYKKFPTQEFINHIAVYTDKVYMTTVRDKNGNGVPLNGNICVTCFGDGKLEVKCSKSDLLFKETAWFKENRTCPEEWK